VKRIFILIPLILAMTVMRGQNGSCKLALVKYNGGGDWYANLETSLKNLALFCNKNIGTSIDPDQDVIELDNRDLFSYPLLHLTGHGNISLNDREIQNLRSYLMGGGFLHIDDNYGMDIFIRREMKKVFPELEFVELPWNHAIYHQSFDFKYGLPKIHEHDGNEAKGYGLIWNGRLICFYSFESDLGDGWESPEVHNDTPEVRTKALKMGANIVQFAFMGDAVE